MHNDRSSTRSCGSLQKNIFITLVCLTVIGTLVQYKFNYVTISRCLSDPKRYVATRVVERLYFEVPTVRTTSALASTPRPIKATDKASRGTSTLSLVTTPRQTCQPQNHVLFLKTHKTGGSTITNILNRYADANNRTILIPRDPTYYSFYWPNKFRLNSVNNLYGNKPDILANHARYSRKSMRFLFPPEQTSYITILRHPVAQWESTFTYMSFPYLLGIHEKEDPLQFFLSNLPDQENILELARNFASLYLIRNPQLFDLGLDYKYYDNETMIKRAIKTIDDDFNLVLMMEHFDESLVLLKRRLCWNIDDIVYFKMNERLNKHKRRKLTEEETEKVKAWNSADLALYNYFAEKFWKEIEKEGDEFQDDLIALRAKKDSYFKTCVEKESVEEAYNAVFVKGFQMRNNLSHSTKSFCKRMLRNELSYLDLFRSKRKRHLLKLEGEHIENFDESKEEANVTVVPFVKETNHMYVKPTRKPTIAKTTSLNKKIEMISDAILNDDRIEQTTTVQPTETVAIYDTATAQDTNTRSTEAVQPIEMIKHVPRDISEVSRGNNQPPQSKSSNKKRRSKRSKNRERRLRPLVKASHDGYSQRETELDIRKYDGKTIVSNA